MIWNLGTGWLIMAVVVVGIISFFLALGLDAIMKGEGFGATGNALLLTGGFFLSVYLLNMYGTRFQDAADAAITGMIGSFAIFLVLAVCKGLADRFL